jgi:hypothetical protein
LPGFASTSASIPRVNAMSFSLSISATSRVGL